uniref:Uncharacterized protein n=1 Tax=Mycena chlorophos TaxID=658473 RepID=A0ABQ0LL81_MYCCL|nr:predicted protein [Mycena chlorophos]
MRYPNPPVLLVVATVGRTGDDAKPLSVVGIQATGYKSVLATSRIHAFSESLPRHPAPLTTSYLLTQHLARRSLTTDGTQLHRLSTNESETPTPLASPMYASLCETSSHTAPPPLLDGSMSRDGTATQSRAGLVVGHKEHAGRTLDERARPSYVVWNWRRIGVGVGAVFNSSSTPRRRALEVEVDLGLCVPPRQRRHPYTAGHTFVQRNRPSVLFTLPQTARGAAPC